MGVGRHAAAVGLDLEERLGGQKAVAADLFAAHHALEQAGAAAGVDLVEGADRRQRSLDQPPIDRHHARPRWASSWNVSKSGVVARRWTDRPVIAGASCRVRSRRAAADTLPARRWLDDGRQAGNRVACAADRGDPSAAGRPALTNRAAARGNLSEPSTHAHRRAGIGGSRSDCAAALQSFRRK